MVEMIERMHWDHENTNFFQRLAVVLAVIVSWMVIFASLGYVAAQHDLWGLYGFVLLAWVSIQIVIKAWNRWGPWVR